MSGDWGRFEPGLGGLSMLPGAWLLVWDIADLAAATTPVAVADFRKSRRSMFASISGGYQLSDLHCNT
jgi:hypothetical protein